MDLALAAAAPARRWTSPNPWVGAALRTTAGATYTGATEPPPGRHAEIVAMDAARAAEGPDAVRGATLATTLEPCSHHGRTPPCADAVVTAGIARVVVGIGDPDVNVSGNGLLRIRNAGIEVREHVRNSEVTTQLLPYLVHRRTGRPYVVLKLAATLDGFTAAPDGTSQWITGEEARRDAHILRAESDVVIVGAGTVRADNPSLTVRHTEGRDPRRVVLGSAPPAAKVHPCREYTGELGTLLEALGREGVVQVLVEGGAAVAHSFHIAGLVDHYVLYLAPALLGGHDGTPLFRGKGAATIGELFRGRIASVQMLGADVRIDLLHPIAI
jgi:diaminohydroxyphosphoribosylaminopyrimidine deaminase / 5-amino-6-(5-phosphoribosylamino)uracil reductase